MPTQRIQLIVGLGNPGAAYADTRHNAGADFVRELARLAGGHLKADARVAGEIAEVSFAGHKLRLLVPGTFMNRSGRSVAALANFYKIEAAQLLIAHDDLDISPGSARFKFDGGHGGHRGLRDIIPALGNRRDFHRLRLGIGHPGCAEQVSAYVLSKACPREREAIAASIDAAIRALPLLLDGDIAKAMTRLHSAGAAQRAGDSAEKTTSRRSRAG